MGPGKKLSPIFYDLKSIELRLVVRHVIREWFLFDKAIATHASCYSWEFMDKENNKGTVPYGTVLYRMIGLDKSLYDAVSYRTVQ